MIHWYVKVCRFRQGRIVNETSSIYSFPVMSLSLVFILQNTLPMFKAVQSRFCIQYRYIEHASMNIYKYQSLFVVNLRVTHFSTYVNYQSNWHKFFISQDFGCSIVTSFIIKWSVWRSSLRLEINSICHQCHASSRGAVISCQTFNTRQRIANNYKWNRNHVVRLFSFLLCECNYRTVYRHVQI